ncbi:hypothetical protein [Pseudonocardia sp. TRM90224]|uniref:hypothetical protein n=1 Tax=Pseudonocardia sp. TRM90224 TaxID=2812678 RepID=UPI001E317967|nr:hypothetical protein [Pseudonocardia sp. TRM90224]
MAARQRKNGNQRVVRRAFSLICAGALVVVSAAACSPPADPTAGTDDPELAAFLKDCDTAMGTWRDGQITYPSSIVLDVGGATSYRATIDIGQQQPGTPKELPGNQTRTEPVVVRCAIAARLVPIGTLKVEPPEWAVRTFTPAAKVDWSWKVSTDQARDLQLRLEIQPAISGEGGFTFVGSNEPQTVSYVTDVVVNASPFQKINQYISDNTAAALGIATALLAFFTFAGTIKKAVLKLFGRLDDGEEDDEESENGNPDTDEPPQSPNRA